MSWSCFANSVHRSSVTSRPVWAPQVTSRPFRTMHSTLRPNVAAPTCSNTTSTPRPAVIRRTSVTRFAREVLTVWSAPERGRAHVLEHHVHPAPGGDPPHLGHQVRTRGVDGVVGAERPRALQLVVARRGADDARTDHAADLHRGR